MDNLRLVLRADAEEFDVEYDDSPASYLYVIRGAVLGIHEESEAQKPPETVGRFTVARVDISRAMNENMPHFDIFDVSSEWLHYFKVLCQPDEEWRSAVLKAIGGHPVNFDVLILHRLELLPEYRGRGLGLLVMRALIARYASGTGVIIVKAFPLQCEARGQQQDAWRRKLQLNEYGKDKSLSRLALQRHYAKLGFKRIGSASSYMVRHAEEPLPRLDELRPEPELTVQ